MILGIGWQGIEGERRKGEIHTNMMVTNVNSTMMLPCCFVDSAVHRADLASETLACFCFKSSR
jgi:hypothetical protein